MMFRNKQNRFDNNIFLKNISLLFDSLAKFESNSRKSLPIIIIFKKRSTKTFEHRKNTLFFFSFSSYPIWTVAKDCIFFLVIAQQKIQESRCSKNKNHNSFEYSMRKKLFTIPVASFEFLFNSFLFHWKIEILFSKLNSPLWFFFENINKNQFLILTLKITF